MRRIAILLLLAVPAAFGYIRLNTGEATTVFLQRVDNTAIQFNLNTGVVPGATSSAGAGGKTVTVISADSDPAAAIRAAIATWNSLSTANVKFLPLKSTTLVHDSADNTNVVSIAASAADVSAVGSAVAITVNTWAAGDGQINGATVTDGSIVDSDILLNPAIAFSTSGSTTTDLQAVMTHELGHSLGANHTGVLGATMFQYASINQRFLSTDDLTFVNVVYPASSSSQAAGTISGTITATGGTPVAYGMLTFIDTAQGITLGGLTNADGTYSVKAPPGSYIMYAEPFNATVQAGNLYLTAAQATQAAATPFQTTFLGSFASPTTVTVTANNTSTANISVTAGLNTLAAPFVGIGKAGASADITNVAQLTGPAQIASGTSFDLGLVGTGYDSTITAANFKVLGQGITVGAVKVDPGFTFGTNLPLVRVTLTVAARETANLATLVFNKGGNTLSLTGVLVIVPPTGAIVPSGFTSAATTSLSGTVSPGEYVTIYGSKIGPSTGPFAGIGYLNGGYDASGFLPPTLGGVSVKFDNVYAPVFFVDAGQINLQVPFEIAGEKNTQVTVSFFGSASNTATVPVATVHPAIFVNPGAGATAVYAANSDNTVNAPGNPVLRGDFVVVYGTGVGKPTYPVQTGFAVSVPQSALNANGFTCTVGGLDAKVLYAGLTPTAVALAQWDVVIPSALTAPGPVSLVCSSGGASTQSNLVVFVK